MNDKRSQILREQQRWAAKRKAIYNEEIGQENPGAAEFTYRGDAPFGSAYEFGRTSASTATGGTVKRAPIDHDVESAMQIRGDLKRFVIDGITFKMVHTTILRDTHKSDLGWEIYNDRGMISDWFYDSDMNGGDEKDYAIKILSAKFAGRQGEDDISTTGPDNGE